MRIACHKERFSERKRQRLSDTFKRRWHVRRESMRTTHIMHVRRKCTCTYPTYRGVGYAARGGVNFVVRVPSDGYLRTGGTVLGARGSSLSVDGNMGTVTVSRHPVVYLKHGECACNEMRNLSSWVYGANNRLDRDQRITNKLRIFTRSRKGNISITRVKRLIFKDHVHGEMICRKYPEINKLLDQ